MIENFNINPPQQQLLVEKIGPIKKTDDGKQYKQDQKIYEYERLPKNINYNNLGPNIYSVQELSDSCNGSRYVLYYDGNTKTYFYFDKNTGQIVANTPYLDTEQVKKNFNRKYMDILGVDLEDTMEVKTKIMNELDHDVQIEKLGVEPLEKLKRAYIKSASLSNPEYLVQDMKDKLKKDDFDIKDTSHYFDDDEIKRLNEISNKELTDEALKLDCPKRKKVTCKNGFTIKYDLQERFGKNCPYMVCNDVSFFEKYKLGLLILIIASIFVIVLLMSI
jgi:hypothetical protein